MNVELPGRLRRRQLGHAPDDSRRAPEGVLAVLGPQLGRRRRHLRLHRLRRGGPGDAASRTRTSISRESAGAAATDADGNDAQFVKNGNCANTPVEVAETRYPFLNMEYQLEPGKVGHGRHRGGFGTRRIFRFLTDGVHISSHTNRHRVKAWGLDGRRGRDEHDHRVPPQGRDGVGAGAGGVRHRVVRQVLEHRHERGRRDAVRHALRRRLRRSARARPASSSSSTGRTSSLARGRREPSTASSSTRRGGPSTPPRRRALAKACSGERRGDGDLPGGQRDAAAAARAASSSPSAASRAERLGHTLVFCSEQCIRVFDTYKAPKYGDEAVWPESTVR